MQRIRLSFARKAMLVVTIGSTATLERSSLGQVLQLQPTLLIRLSVLPEYQQGRPLRNSPKPCLPVVMTGCPQTLRRDPNPVSQTVPAPAVSVGQSHCPPGQQ
jgi:hypothetical protein